MSANIFPGQVVNLQAYTSSTLGWSNYIIVWIDWNRNGSFTDAGETYSNTSWQAYNDWVYAPIAVPCSVTPGTCRMRIICQPVPYGMITSPCYYNTSPFYYGEAEDYNINVQTSLAMTYDSAYATHPDTTPVFFAQIKAKILQVNVKTSGSPCVSVLYLDSLFLSTSGTTNPSDLLNFRLYSQDGNPLDDGNLLTSIANPNGKIKIDAGHYPLGAGVTSAIVAYDISPGATVGHVIECSFDSLYIGGVKYYPKKRNPAGKRRIVHQANFNGYCPVTRTNIANYAVGIKKVKFESIDNPTQTWPGPNVYNFYPSPIPTVFRQKTYPFTINHGELNSQAAAVYIDWDNDGYFSSSGESMIGWTNQDEGSISTGFLTIPCLAPSGFHRMRISSDIGLTYPAACGTTGYGEIEDYLIYVPPENNPAVYYTKKDTVGYVGSQVVLNPHTNIDGSIDYQWDFDNDGIWDQTAGTGMTTFSTPGYKKIRLQAILYGCTQTYYSNIFIDSIKILTPTKQPSANFIADLNVVTTSIPVNLYDLSTMGTFSWKWKITPDSVQGLPAYIIMPSDTAQNPRIMFNALGNYNVSLIARNIMGADTEIKLKYIQVIKDMLFCQDIDSRLTTGYLYDDGGKYANYTNPTTGLERYCYFLIHPKCAKAITLDFLDFDVCSYGITTCPLVSPDYIKIYDGSTTTGTPLHLQFLDMLGQPLYPSGFMNGPNNMLRPLPPSTTATSGSMLVEFHVNCMAKAVGFEARWSTQLYSPNPPNAQIAGTDTVYTGKNACFHSTSTGYDLDYQWDFDGDHIIDSYDSASSFIYTSPGTYHPRLIITSCEFKDTAYFTVIVKNPNSLPYVNFVADFTKVSKNTKVIFTDLSDNTIYEWKWKFTPNNVEYYDGTDSTSPNPHVKFTDSGYFDVMLCATNSLGTRDSLKKKYILVYIPCNPMVLNKNSDIGISQVVLEDINGTKLINHNSAIGTTGYTDYSNLNKSHVYQRGTYKLTLKRNTNFNNISWTVWIDYNQNGIFENNERVADLLNSPLTTWTINLTIPSTSNTGIVVMRIAANTGIQQNLPCGPNYCGEFEDYWLIISKDIIKPVLTLIPPDTLTLTGCSTYSEPGFSAWDMVNGDLTSNVVVTGTIDSLVPGFYYKRYNVSDPSGNDAEQKTRVIHILRDIIPPTIILNGKNPDSVATGTIYTDPGHLTTDDCSGIASDSVINMVDKNIVGTYNIFYKARDKSNPYNQTIATRKVVVYDKIDPVMTLKGPNPQYIEVKTPFVDSGVTITDNYYTGLTPVITGTVDTAVLGKYFITYCITDPSGNGPVCLDRVVVVQDKTAPSITLMGNALELVDVATEYKEPGYTVSDNYWSTGDILTRISGTVNTYILGDNILSYQAFDASGNISAIVQRTVRVVDRVAPTIEIVGETSIAVQRWGNYTDPGVTVCDNYYPASALIVHYNETGTFENTLLPGLFTYSYKVCDPSGNCSGEIIRMVYVYETEKTLGLSDNNNYHFAYYPNPANDILNISLDLPDILPVNISIYDAVGKNVMNAGKGEVKSATFKLDIAGLNAGIYHIRFNINGTETNRKFIINR